MRSGVLTSISSR